MSAAALQAEATTLHDSALAISVKNLCKSFGDTQALAGVSFSVQQGELFAIAGPDGAGKTTLCHLLAGISRPSSGSLFVFGKPAHEQQRQIGYLTQQFSLHSDLSVEANVRYMADIRRVQPRLAMERTEHLLRMVGLDCFRSRLAGNLSGGMKQKLSLCCALISSPKLLVLDEPTTGLDPVSRSEFWQLLAHVQEQGTTIFISTPQFDEADHCDRIALVRESRLLACGTRDDLRAQHNLTRLQIITPSVEKVFAVLTDIQREQHFTGATLRDVHVFGDRIDVLTENQHQAMSTLTRAICEPISVNELTMENVFALLTGESIAGEAPAQLPALTTIVGGDVRQSPLSARNLRKTFGSFQAVADFSLDLRSGEIYGLLGANGAGKSTTVQMLCGLIKPTSASTSILGCSPYKRNGSLNCQIGYMSQKFSLYEDLTIAENLAFYASAYKLTRQLQEQQTEWVLSFCDVRAQKDRLVKELPRGLRQRIAFGASVMHNPAVLFLDEPTAGTDPSARRDVWGVIRQLANNGTAVLVTTHFLTDAEYCHRLGLMRQGQLISEGSPAQIKAQAGNVAMTLEEAFVAIVQAQGGLPN